MKELIIIAGVNGTGKSSFLGILKSQGLINFCSEKEIDGCIERGESVTQETTLSGHRIKRTVTTAKEKGYKITLYYIGLNTKYESIFRIENRVKRADTISTPKMLNAVLINALTI